MGDLAEFTKLFTDLEDRVIELDKKDTQITIELKSKEARRAFLIEEIKQLEARRNNQVTKQAEALDQAQAEQEAVRQETTELETNLSRLKQKHQQEKQLLDDQLVELRKQITAITQAIKDGRHSVGDLKQEQAELTTEIEDLRKIIIDTQVEVEQAEARLVAKQTEVAQAIKSLETDEAKARTELVEIDGKVEQAEADLTVAQDKVKAAQAQLGKTIAEIQKMAKATQDRAKALDSREDSIAEQERQLQVRIITSRRRTASLENLS